MKETAVFLGHFQIELSRPRAQSVSGPPNKAFIIMIMKTNLFFSLALLAAGSLLAADSTPKMM
jgi:hypothetical protein